MLSQTLHTRYDSHRLWDLRTGEIIRVFDTSSFWLAKFLAINPNGQALARGRRLGKVQVWNLYTDEIICSAAWNSPTAMTTDVEF